MISAIEKCIKDLSMKLITEQKMFNETFIQLQDQIATRDESGLGSIPKRTKITNSTTKVTAPNTSYKNEAFSDNKTNQGHFSMTRIYHNIAQRFKDKENKYGGTDDEDLFEQRIRYESIADVYNMAEKHKCKYIHNLFKSGALCYYSSNVKYTATSYIEVKKLMLVHFNSPDVQARVKNELMNLNFQSFIEKEGSRTKALPSMAAYISNRPQKCPEASRQQTHRVEFLRKALIKEKWATTILLEIIENIDYQKFYTRLANALQLFEEAIDHDEEKETQHNKSTKPTIFFM